jgi:hypothetical protein
MAKIGSKIGRIAGGIATLGLSEVVAQPLSKAREQSDAAIDRIQNRELPTLQLGDGAGVGRIRGSLDRIDVDAPQGKVTTAAFAGPRESARYIKGLQAGLGLKGPQSALDETRKASTMQLEQGTLAQAVRDSQQLAAQGQSTGSRSQALASLRGQTLEGQKAQLEADLRQEEAGQMAAYESQLLRMAQEQGGALTGARQESARAMTEGSFNNAQARAQRELQQAEMALTSGEALNAEEYKRRMAEYENALAKIQQANTGDMIQLTDAQAKRANIAGGLTAGIGAGAKIASSAIG